MLSVLFVDIRGFTSLAEKTSPTDIASQLNRFYDLASKAIFRQDGTLDKLVGDQVMAFFGPPLNHEDHARRAVTTALEIRRAISEFAPTDTLAIGVGITTGEAFVGNVGGADVTDYTVLGDTVNVAARLESEALSGEILISQQTYDRVADDFPHATRRELLLKGKSERVIAWQIAATIATADS
jgi:adenylate cyclase